MLVANNENDIDTAIVRVANVITVEYRDFKRDQSTYKTKMCLDDALASSSPTIVKCVVSSINKT